MRKIFMMNGTLDEGGEVNEKLFREKGWKLVKIKEKR